MVPHYRRDSAIPGISCQLYSDRMRKVFRDAVQWNDFEYLRQAALGRYKIERNLQEKQMLLEQDMRTGIDRRTEIEQNMAVWKQWE